MAAAETAAQAHARAEEELAAAEARFAEAESAAGNWQGRADALAQALDAANDAEAAAVLDGMVGVAGALVNHLVIEPGAERAVAAALGDAMGSVIVSGRDEARGAIERSPPATPAPGCSCSTPPTPPSPPAPPSRRRAPGRSPGCVRAGAPGLQATLARTLAGVVLADGDWRAAMDLAARTPTSRS